MTVAQTRTVDWLAIAKDNEHILLSVVDDVDWSDEQGLLLVLQEKLNTYLSFVESGEVLDRVVQVAGFRLPATTPVRVKIYGRFELTSRARAFIAHATERFQTAGLSLEFQLLDPADGPEGAS